MTSTADIISSRDDVQTISGTLLDLGGSASFEGPIRTVLSPGDHGLARRLLGEPGGGAVLVVDGGGRTDLALLGDDMVALGLDNGWVGVILNGAVRDREGLRSRPFGVKAVGSNPRSSPKTGSGSVDVRVQFAGATFSPGRYVWADADGIVVER